MATNTPEGMRDQRSPTSYAVQQNAVACHTTPDLERIRAARRGLSEAAEAFPALVSGADTSAAWLDALPELLDEEAPPAENAASAAEVHGVKRQRLCSYVLARAAMHAVEREVGEAAEAVAKAARLPATARAAEIARASRTLDARRNALNRAAELSSLTFDAVYYEGESADVRRRLRVLDSFDSNGPSEAEREEQALKDDCERRALALVGNGGAA